jgi:hypothetical protein
MMLLRSNVRLVRRVCKFAYGFAVLIFFIYAISSYPSAATYYANLWSGRERLDVFDFSLQNSVVICKVGRVGGELRILLLRTYFEPQAQKMLVKVKVLSGDGGEMLYTFNEETTAGHLTIYTIYAPKAQYVQVEVEVDGVRVVKEVWLSGS